MEATRWQTIKALLAEVLDRPVDERSIYLDQACPDDPDLRAYIDAVLASYTQPSLFETPAVARLPGYAGFVLQAALPDSIGPYRVLQPLGRGGMGIVFLSVRDDREFEQKVAIKLAFGTAHDEYRRRRFISERQILAKLNHPNIARLYDGGVTEAGFPYLVMEYVEGRPIDKYCDERGLSFDQRLQLFIKVCHTVQFAHQNLIVHRDLKPSNILVTESGDPKLLDFGIAKLLGREHEPLSVTLTRSDMRVMTPEYASPEQVRGDTITTAADVYTLGILLYRLLTGQRPYQLTNRLPHEIERVICEDDPLRPSTAVLQNTDPDHPVVKASHLSPAGLKKRLQGDLDNIILTALRKAPSDRYASADHLVTDLSRYLNKQPITARKQTLWYRTGKFIRRHRIGVAVTFTTLVLTCISAFALYLQAQQIVDERDRANRVLDYVVSLFEVLDPEEGASAELVEAGRAIVDAGVEKAENELAERPDEQAQFLRLMGDLYLRLGFYKEGGETHEKALKIRDKVLPISHVDRVESLYRLGVAYQLQGDLQRADSLLQEALSLAKMVPAPNLEHVIEAMGWYGNLHTHLGKLDEAESILRESISIGEAALGSGHKTVLKNTGALISTLLTKHELDEALQLALSTVAVTSQEYGNSHMNTANSIKSLARVYKFREAYSKADSLYTLAISIAIDRLGKTHPTVASWLNMHALLSQSMNQIDKAEAIYRDIIEIYNHRFGNSSLQLADPLNNLARLLWKRGDYENAEKIYLRVLNIEHQHSIQSNPSTGITLTNLAFLLSDMGKLDDGIRYVNKSLEIFKKTLPTIHPYLGFAYRIQGTLRLKQKKYRQAANSFRTCLRIREQAYAPGHHLIGEAQSLLGEALTKTKDYKEAERFLLQGYETIKVTRGDNHLETLAARKRLSLLYTTTNANAQARINSVTN